MESVSCNLQTSSDFPQLASTCSDCKMGEKSGQKSRSVFQFLLTGGKFSKLIITIFLYGLKKVSYAHQDCLFDKNTIKQYYH